MKTIKRIQLSMPIDMHKRLKDNMQKYGFSSLVPFIRFIIHQFLSKE